LKVVCDRRIRKKFSGDMTMQDNIRAVTGSHAGAGRRDFLKRAMAATAVISVPSLAWSQTQKVNVGVVVPLSGANAEFGKNSQRGIQLVADQINAAGGIKSLGGAKINLIVADSTSTPTTAATVAQRLVTENRCVGILGAYASSLTLAVMQVTERRRVPLLTMSFSDEITGSGYKYVFQIVPKASVIGEAQFNYPLAALSKIEKLSIKKAAVMYEDTAYGTSQAKGLRSAAKQANVELVMDEAYSPGISDATPLINKLRGSGAEMVFPVSYFNDSILIIRTMRQQNIDTPVIGGAAGYVIPAFAQALGNTVEGILSIDTSNYDEKPEYTGVYQKKYGVFATHEAIENAACMYVLAQAVDIAKSVDPKAVRDALASTRFSTGWATTMPGGSVKFDDHGLNTVATPILVQWQNNGLVTVYPESVAKGSIKISGRV
jgi:branched-chain amino acid transport system substrate-binding protein